MTKKLYDRNRVFPTADQVVAECKRLQAHPLLDGYELLRIYYYDAYPASETVRRPVSREPYNLSNTDRYRAAQRLFDQLVLKPHFALRMGHVILSPHKWRIKPRIARALAAPRDPVPGPLADGDFELDAKQVGVDMRIGMDMARIALREMARSIVVVTGDSDFVPAFKFVRREGIKVILDPMGHNVRVELRQHADVVL